MECHYCQYNIPRDQIFDGILSFDGCFGVDCPRCRKFNPVPKAWEDKRVMKAFLSIAKRFICPCQSMEDCPHFILRQLLCMYPCLAGEIAKEADAEGATAVLNFIS